MVCPGFRGVRLLDSCHGDRCRVLELYGCEPAEGGVPAAAVVEDLEVVEHRVGQLDAGVPSMAVEELDLHPGPEGLDDGVVVAVADGSHRGDQAGLLGAGGEGQRAELPGLNRSL